MIRWHRLSAVATLSGAKLVDGAAASQAAGRAMAVKSQSISTCCSQCSSLCHNRASCMCLQCTRQPALDRPAGISDAVRHCCETMQCKCYAERHRGHAQGIAYLHITPQGAPHVLAVAHSIAAPLDAVASLQPPPLSSWRSQTADSGTPAPTVCIGSSNVVPKRTQGTSAAQLHLFFTSVLRARSVVVIWWNLAGTHLPFCS